MTQLAGSDAKLLFGSTSGNIAARPGYISSDSGHSVVDGVDVPDRVPPRRERDREDIEKAGNLTRISSDFEGGSVVVRTL